jgi:protein SCO1/2
LIDYNDESKLTEDEKKIRIGGYWALKDLDGNDYSSYKLEGSYYLLFFGFSLCPDVCPLSLMKMTKAVNKIRNSNEGKFFKLKPVFVTVNPDYDTP